MENILGQLHCRCRRSCRRALSTRRQCATQTVSCVLDKDYLCFCVCVLINCESKIDVAFFLFIVVCERATVRVCVLCWCACECLWVIAAIVWLLSGPSLRPFVFLFYQWFMRRIWRCVTYSHLRARTNTHTHTLAYSLTHTLGHKVEHAKRWQRRHESTWLMFALWAAIVAVIDSFILWYMFFASGQALSWHFELGEPTPTYAHTITKKLTHTTRTETHTHQLTDPRCKLPVKTEEKTNTHI